MAIRRAATSSVTKSGSGIADVPDAPTGLTATDSGDGTTASVSFTPAVTGGTATSYTVTSSPGSFTGTGASSPISVTGLTAGTAYTFTATATNSKGTSPSSSASGSLTLANVGSYFLIERVNVGAGNSATITFSSIPSTYTHLELRVLSRDNRTSPTSVTATYSWIRFNSDTGTNYSDHYLSGNGASTSAFADTGYSYIYGFYNASSAASANIFATSVISILDYANTSKYKTVRTLTGHDQNGSGSVALASGNWRSTAAISTITITPDIGSFIQYSTFALYGIKGA